MAGRKPTREEGFDWLANASENWLLIIDDVDSGDEFDAAVDQYIPPSRTGCILITTRNKLWTAAANTGSLEVGRMPLADGITLLLKVSRIPDQDFFARAEAKPIVEELDCLAVFLYHAGTAINQSPRKLQGYTGFHAHAFPKVGDHNDIKKPTGKKKSIQTTFEISRRRVEEMGTAESVLACEILDVASTYHHQNIPETLFLCLPPRQQGRPKTLWDYFRSLIARPKPPESAETATLEAPNDLSELLGDPGGTPFPQVWRRDLELVRQAVILLDQFCLINFDVTPESFSMNRMVHEWTRQRLAKQDRAWSRLAGATGLVSAITDLEQRDAIYCEGRRRLLPHASSFLFPASVQRSRSSGGKSQRFSGTLLNAPQSRMAAKLATVFVESGVYAKAEDLYQAALTGLDGAHEESHLDTLAVAHRLGVVMERRNKYVEAQGLIKRSIEGRRRQLGDEHSLTLESWSSLAFVLNSREECRLAEMLNRLVLEKRERSLPPDSLDVIDSVHNLAVCLNHQAKYWEATKLLTRATLWREKYRGPLHRDTIESLEVLASALHNQSLFDDAATVYQEALSRKKALLGKGHLETLTTMSDLAWALVSKGDIEKAGELSEKAYKAVKAHAGAGKSYAPLVLSTLARVHFARGDHLKAEELSRKAISGFETDGLASLHPDILHCQLHLAIVLRKLKELDEAERLYRIILAAHLKRPLQPNQDTMVCLTNLGVVLEEQERWDEAEQAHRDAYHGLERLLPRHHLKTTESLENYARVLNRQRKYPEAETMFYRAIEMRKALYGLSDLSTLRTIARLAHTLHTQRKYETAWTLYQAACEGFTAAGDRMSSHAKRCVKRFEALKRDFQPAQVFLPSTEQHEWAQRLLAPASGEQKPVGAGDFNGKRSRSSDPSEGTGERAAKFVRLA